MKENETQGVGNKNWGKALLKTFLRLILFLVVVILLCSFLIQIPAIQNWTVDRFISKFSKDLNTKVTLDHVNLNIFKGLELKEFYMEDMDGDTLLHTHSLSTGFNRNMLSLLKNELYLNKLKLEDGQFNLITKKGSSLNNFAQLFKKKQGEDAGESKSFDIDLNELDLTNIIFRLSNENDGKEEEYSIRKGNIVFNEIDLDKNRFSIKNLFLENPVININKLKTEVTVKDEKQQENVNQIIKSVEPDSSNIFIQKLVIVKGQLSLNDFNKEDRFANKDILDFNRLNIIDLELDVENLKYKGDPDIFMDINNLSFKTDKSFELISLKSESCVITSKKIELEGLELITPKTQIRDKLVFKYRDLKDFESFADKVIIQANLVKSTIAFNDIATFSEDLYNNPFFIQNKNRTVKFDGTILGKVSNLSGRKLKVSIPGQISFAGSFSTRNLNTSGEELVNLKLDYLDTDMAAIKSVVPGFTPPDNFYKLGKINFKGRFDGYFKDFVAFGTVKSDLGTANLDMRLDVNEGKDLANYSGKLNLYDFDLKTWTDNNEFGKISLVSQVTNGKGLSLNSASAKLDANIQSFVFKDYNYQNLILDGILNKNLFDGDVFIKDDNIDLSFSGNLLLQDSIPILDFTADIQKLDLRKLNLVKDSIAISGGLDINLRGRDINSIVGTANLKDFNIKLNNKNHQLDFVEIISSAFPGGDRRIDINSEVMNGNIEGEFDLAKLDDALFTSLKKNYPELYRALGIKEGFTPTANQDFRLEALIKKTNNLFRFVGLGDLNLDQTLLKVNLDSRNDIIDLDIKSPRISIDDKVFRDANIVFKSKSDQGNLELDLNSFTIGSTNFNPVHITTLLKGGQLEFDIATANIVDTIEQIHLAGIIESTSENYTLSFKDSEVLMLGTNWNFNPANKVYWKEKKINVENFSLNDGQRFISLDNIGRKGLNLNLKNFNLSLLNDFFSYDKLDYDGLIDLNVSSQDVFNQKDFNLNLTVPELLINGDNFGVLNLAANTRDFLTPLSYTLTLNDRDQKVLTDGTFNLQESYLQGVLVTENFPLSIIEYWIASGIEGTKGDVMINATYSGKLPDIKIDGSGIINDGGIGVDYLGTYYTFDKQKIGISEKAFDLTGAILEDGFGNTAIAEGVIFHDLFGGFGAKARIVSDNFVALNTKKGDNPLYYGFAQGPFTVDFNGLFDALDISVIGETGPKTFLKIPVGDIYDEADESFIKIIDQDKYFASKEEKNQSVELGGISFNMNLAVTPAAETFIVFDERKGDVIRGTGRGNIQLEINRKGDFELYGDYQIEEGDYLFTAWSFVNKPFTVRRGGTIKWTGDPFNATINIEADYEGVRTSLNTFLAEYLGQGVSENVKRDARKKTDVDLILKLTGELYNPTINFDLNFPDVSGELKSYADSKMRVLRANENALNDQVFGLLVFQTFLPTNNLLGDQIFTSDNLWYSGVNTISEFVSSQLSMLISGLLQEGIADNAFISGIDFEIGFTHNSFLNQDQDNDLLPDEVDLHIRNRFLDDRWSIVLGGNFVRQSETNLYGSYLAGDFVVEYYLTEDRKLKVKAYGIYDFDEVESQRRQKYGLGISFRTEFSTLKRFKDGVGEAADELKGASSQINK